MADSNTLRASGPITRPEEDCGCACDDGSARIQFQSDEFDHETVQCCCLVCGPPGLDGVRRCNVQLIPFFNRVVMKRINDPQAKATVNDIDPQIYFCVYCRDQGELGMRRRAVLNKRSSTDKRSRSRSRGRSSALGSRRACKQKWLQDGCEGDTH